MRSYFTHTVRASVIITLMLFLFSCASYNTQINKYYGLMTASEYEKAFHSIDHIKRLNAGRNRLLYLLEKGKMAHLMELYDSSNAYFNAADLFMEDIRTSAKDVALGNLLNPMMETYKGEDFEKFMVHYYKALNYLYLGNQEEALVEARRITLRSYAQQDKTGNKDSRYSDDAFSLLLQGILYERARDINNAFISYRNAADIFLKNNEQYYGVPMPAQLKQDVLRTAQQMGFNDQVTRYEQLFHTSYHPAREGSGGELVVFWENGLAPVKVQQDFFFALNKDAGGNFFFTDPAGSYSIPFDFSSYNDRNSLSVNDIRSLHVAFPRYQEQPVTYRNATLVAGNKQYTFEPAQNINQLAPAVLKERFLKDMSKTLTRLAIKKIAEAAARPKEDDKKKKEKEAMTTAIQLFNLLSEKADTRNWQSLPHTISYTRVPLEKGENVMTVDLSGLATKQLIINVTGTGRLEVRNVCVVR